MRTSTEACLWVRSAYDTHSVSLTYESSTSQHFGWFNFVFAPLSPTTISAEHYDWIEPIAANLFVHESPVESIWDRITTILVSKMAPPSAFVLIFREKDDVHTRIFLYQDIRVNAYGQHVKCPACNGGTQIRKRHTDNFCKITCLAASCEFKGKLHQPPWLQPLRKSSQHWFWAPYPFPVPGWPRACDIQRREASNAIGQKVTGTKGRKRAKRIDGCSGGVRLGVTNGGPQNLGG